MSLDDLIKINKHLDSAVVEQIKTLQSMMTNSERVEFWGQIKEGYCELCGTPHLPCYCAPCYDE